ncbi:uncharacterized protein LOC123272815 isoform X2 [Cotesia glomerata]|uniref:uncharacterized protein LOC123272815 isoform X2 n=1 Tax=Cotesia glomerata TaxID=32391 RepID=UPI001D002210|nr:uncharacterized protein LOC123272815 isoform X2 [Cotesia glomerata]
MNLKIKSLCVLLILSITPSSSQINPKALIEVAKYGWKAIQALIAIDSSVKNHKFQQDVINALDEIRQSTARIESLITDEANRIIEELKVKIDMQIVGKFVRAVFEINERFEKKFLRYFTDNDTYQPETIENYINETIYSSDFKRALARIQEYTVPNHYIPHVDEKLVFEILHDYIKIKKNHLCECNEGESSYDLIFGVFNLAMTALSKGYAMVAHAYRYRQCNSTNPEIRDTLDDYKETALKIAEVARLAGEMESKAIRRCDPEKFKEGENYESYQFLTTLVSNNYMINNRDYIMSYVNYYSERSASFCDGFLYDKMYDEYFVEAYLAPVNSKRRYCYARVRGGDLQWYYKGRITEGCDYDYGLYYPRQWGHLDFSKYLCSQPSLSKKSAYINLTSAYWDTPFTNQVITGIRLVTKLSITYFEIQQGVLVNGTIDNTTVKWDDRVTKKLEDMEKNNQIPDYASRDLTELSYHNRILNLDDIILPAGWAVVGVTFQQSRGNPIVLQVAGVKIIDESGNPIISTDVHWFSGTNNLNRNEITKSDLDIPTLGKTKNGELSEPGKHFAKFQMTGWVVDAGQTLIPFIDMQKVVTNPPAPIGGVGLYYKGHNGYGGFIAPKLLSMNNTIYMSENYLKKTFNDTSNYSDNYDRYYHYSVISA